jgi:hypothetical protein
MFEVSTFYACDGMLFDKDEIAMDAVGRDTDDSGWGSGERDLGWTCKTLREAQKIAIALENIGMPAAVEKIER